MKISPESEPCLAMWAASTSTRNAGNDTERRDALVLGDPNVRWPRTSVSVFDPEGASEEVDAVDAQRGEFSEAKPGVRGAQHQCAVAEERSNALIGFLHFYNHHRTHGSLNWQPPFSTLNQFLQDNVPVQHT